MLPASAPACQPAAVEEGVSGFPSAVILAPWVAEPYRLWSLWDMLRFYAAEFFEAFNNLMYVEQQVRLLTLDPGQFSGVVYKDWPSLDRAVKEALAKIKEVCVKSSLPVSPNFKGQFNTAREITFGESETVNTYGIAALSQVRQGLLAELMGHQFYAVAPAHAEKMASVTPFGERVDNRFHGIAQDVAAAGRCLALDEWTACVFHLMRVLEHGLHRFAEHLGVTMKHDLEVENWGEILNAIQGAIRRLEETTKSKERNERLQRYSEAASQFRHFKHAWRTYVIHTPETYDSRQAERVWDATRDFMESLVEVLGEGG